MNHVAAEHDDCIRAAGPIFEMQQIDRKEERRQDGGDAGEQQTGRKSKPITAESFPTVHLKQQSGDGRSGVLTTKYTKHTKKISERDALVFGLPFVYLVYFVVSHLSLRFLGCRRY